MMKRRNMLREPTSALPWQGCRTFGFGGGFVMPAVARDRLAEASSQLASMRRAWDQAIERARAAGGGDVALPRVIDLREQ